MLDIHVSSFSRVATRILISSDERTCVHNDITYRRRAAKWNKRCSYLMNPNAQFRYISLVTVLIMLHIDKFCPLALHDRNPCKLFKCCLQRCHCAINETDPRIVKRIWKEWGNRSWELRLDCEIHLIGK